MGVKLGHYHRGRMFENKGLRRILGTKRDEVTRERRKLNNEELNDLHCSPNIIRMIKKNEVGGACRAYG
jgi:hypothetical protein